MAMLHIDDPVLVEALLADRDRLGVRPPDQPVPPHLGQGPLARAFARWLRMRDDAGHAPAKTAMMAALARLDDVAIERQARAQAALALPGGWDHWVWATSSSSMAGLLGFAPRDLHAQRALVARLHAIARGLAPTASTEQVAAADAACAEVMGQLADSRAWRLGLPDADDELPNKLALLWQSFEAGAALMGQAIIALAQDPALRRPGAMAAWLPHLVSERGAVLNTRRFARAELHVGGQTLQRGDGIVVRLGNHGFGHGPHQCPGHHVALTIAATALETLLREPSITWPTEWKLLALPNANIPFFQESPR